MAGTKLGKGGEIQLTDALKVLAAKEDMYAYIFKGKRYDVGGKLGFLEATVKFALGRPELREEFLSYLGFIMRICYIVYQILGAFTAFSVKFSDWNTSYIRTVIETNFNVCLETLKGAKQTLNIKYGDKVYPKN